MQSVCVLILLSSAQTSPFLKEPSLCPRLLLLQLVPLLFLRKFAGALHQGCLASPQQATLEALVVWLPSSSAAVCSSLGLRPSDPRAALGSAHLPPPHTWEGHPDDQSTPVSPLTPGCAPACCVLLPSPFLLSENSGFSPVSGAIFGEMMS